jgi:hypothetical protein
MPRNSSASVYVGTFMLCFGLLAFEVFCARLLSVVVGDFLVIFVIALAMLGMSTAASVMSLTRWPPRGEPKYKQISLLCLTLGVAYLGTLFFLTLSNDYYNVQLSRAMDIGGLDSLVSIFFNSFFAKIALTGIILSIPYFIYGIAIVVVFRSSPPQSFHKLYFADLAGAALGAIFCIVALEFAGYAGALLAVAVATFLAAAAFKFQHRRSIPVFPLLGVVVSLVIALSPTLLERFEPVPNINSLARNYNQTGMVDETWHTWNSHARVARLTLSTQDNKPVRDIYAQGDGTGWANVPSLNVEYSTRAFQASLTSALKPKKVLVMFAGVGFDMLAIDHLCQGMCDITGVEINSQMIEHALAKSSELSEFFQRKNINLVHAEAREFLERDKNTYDAILLAWSGAGYSYYVGSSGVLAQYMYTKEAFESLLDHLSDSGIIVISEGSKARSIFTFRQIFEERGLGPLKRSVIALKDNNVRVQIHTSGRLDLHDNSRLMIKPSGFSDEEIDVVAEAGRLSNHRLIYSANQVDPDYALYREISETSDVGVVQARLLGERDIELRSATDDRPFFLNMVPRSFYASPGTLLAASHAEDAPELRLTRQLVKLFIFLGVIALILILGPLYLSDGPAANWRNVNHLLYFLGLGIGFMLIEVGLVQKFGLVLGNPAHAIAIVLAAIILSTGVGSFYSEYMFRSGILNFQRVTAVLLVYIAALLLALDHVVATLLPWSIVYKVPTIMLILFPLGFMLGQFFPQGLRKVESQDTRLVPWAWALNGAASTIAVGVGVMLSYPLGYQSVIIAGASCYLIILILPEYRSHKN